MNSFHSKNATNLFSRPKLYEGSYSKFPTCKKCSVFIFKPKCHELIFTSKIPGINLYAKNARVFIFMALALYNSARSYYIKILHSQRDDKSCHGTHANNRSWSFPLRSPSFNQRFNDHTAFCSLLKRLACLVWFVFGCLWWNSENKRNVTLIKFRPICNEIFNIVIKPPEQVEGEESPINSGLGFLHCKKSGVVRQPLITRWQSWYHLVLKLYRPVLYVYIIKL